MKQVLSRLIFQVSFVFALWSASALASPPKRVAVVVLSYEDSWLSYAGEEFFNFSLWNRMVGKYHWVYSVRGRSLNEDSIRNAMKKALKTGRTVDLFMSMHSYKDGTVRLAPSGEKAVMGDILAPVIEPKHKHQLGLAIHFGCKNTAHRDQYFELGFQSYVGHLGNSVGALAMHEFLYHWLGCDDLVTAMWRTNTNLDDTYLNYHVPRALYKIVAKKPSYNATMLGYGENQQLCGYVVCANGACAYEDSDERPWKPPF